MVNHDKSRKGGGEWVDDMYERTAVISSSAEENDRSGMFSRFKDSFKRAEFENNNTHNLEDDEKGDLQPYELTKLKQTMKSRHVVMMSLGTGIGTGLLVANGLSLRNGGPAGLIIGYLFVSLAAYIMMHAAGEMAVAFPSLPGGYNAYSSIFISQPIGFATVWLYCVQWMTVLPLEIITSTMIIKYWTDSVSPAIFVTIFLLFISGIHFFGARGYGEAEFIFNSCKVLMIFGFILLALLTICGAVGTDTYIGTRYWHNPGPFYVGPPLTKLKGFAYVLVTGFFSYGGMELYALSVNELPNPRKAIPSACKKSAYRMVIVYVLTMILITFLVPSDSDQLMGSHGGGSHASPYVLAMSLHGVKVVPHLLNAVILISVISVGNSAMYSGSRLLCSLAQQGYAPRQFDYVDRSGRPLVALLACTTLGLLAYISVSNKEEEVFQWLASLNGLSEVFTWTTICLSHYRFRKAMRLQGKPLDTLGYKSITGELGSLFVVIFNIIVFVAQFWVALFPIGNDGAADIESFFKAYLAFPLWLVMVIAYMIHNKSWRILNPLKSIDLDAGRRIYDADILKQEDIEYRERIKHSSWYTKMVEFWC